VDDEEAGVWQSDIDGPAVGGPADWEAEPVLDGVEPPAGAPRTAPDTPGSGPRDVCEAPVLEPHEDEILLVASSDGIEPSLDLEPGLAGVGGYASDTPERTVMRPGSGQPKAPEGRLDGSEALIVSGHLGVVRGPSVDQVERSIESGLTTLTWRAPEGEPCEVLEDVGPAVRPMPFEAEAGEDHAVDGFARAGEDGDAPPNMLATPDMLETIEGAISSDASDDERLNLRETLAGTPEPADLELPEVDLRYGLEPLELTAATEGPEESDAHGPHAESIEASEVEADATTALEVGLEQMLATQQDAAAARGDQRDESGLETAEVEEAFLDTAEVEEPVADSQEVEDVESFAFEVYELEAPGGATDEPVEASPSLTSEDADVPEVELEAQEVELEVQEVELEAPEAEAGVAEHAAAASYQDPGAGEPDLEEVDFDPDVSEVEVEVEVTESWPESAEPRPVTPLADSSSLT